MTYPSVDPVVQYTATSGQTLFNGTFKIFETSDVSVYQTPVGDTPDPTTDLLTEGTDYSITISGDSFTMTLVVAAAAGDIITLESSIANSRTTDFGYGGSFTGTEIDLQLNKITALINQVYGLITKRGLLYQITDTIDSGQTTLPKLEANQIWKANSSGNLVGVEGTTETCSTLRSELASQTVSAPGTDEVGYYSVPMGGGTSLSDYLVAMGEIVRIGTTTGGATTYVLTLSTGLDAYYAGMHLYVKFNVANNSNATLNVDTLGAANLVHADGTQVVANDLDTSFYYHIIYDGTSFAILSQTGSHVRTTLTPDFNNVIISNNATDPDHDIDNAAGVCMDSTNTVELSVSALTKRLDAVWAEGTNQGGRASGVSLTADTTYHDFVIGKTDGSTDRGQDTDIDGTNLLLDATDYTYVRRVGSVRTDGSANILPMHVYNISGSKYFIFDSPTISDSMSVANGSAVSVIVDTPSNLTGIRVILNISVTVAGGGGAYYLSGTNQDDLSPSSTVTPLATETIIGSGSSEHQVECMVDTSQRVRLRLSCSYPATVKVATVGWIE